VISVRTLMVVLVVCSISAMTFGKNQRSMQPASALYPTRSPPFVLQKRS